MTGFDMKSLDELFGIQDADSSFDFEEIPLSQIDSFPNHPFKVVDNDDMQQLADSVKENGVINPAIVRFKSDGRYELISGHRRKRACELAGLTTLKCTIKDISDEDATVYMVDSNFQRSKVLPSEKAFAYKMRFAYEAQTACDRNNFVLDVTVVPGNVNDSVSFDELYEKVTNRFAEIQVVTADAGYKTPWICKRIIDDGRIPSMPYKRPMTKKGFFRKYDYVYDEYYDCYICPNDKILKYTTTNRDGYREYKSNLCDCAKCEKINQCTESKNKQKLVTRHIWENYIEAAEDIRHSALGKETYSMRSQTIERVFADAKEKHAMRYTPYRGLNQVTNWVRLKFAAMNLKKIAIWKFKNKNFHVFQGFLSQLFKMFNITDRKPCLA